MPLRSGRMTNQWFLRLPPRKGRQLFFCATRSEPLPRQS